jgi:homoserine dehydrogenase
MDSCNIGLLGAGTVGGGVVKILSRQARFFAGGLDLPIRLTRIVDKDASRFETLPVDEAVCGDSFDELIADDSIDIIVELIGGAGFAKTAVLRAIDAGKHVVTANKALLAEHGAEIFEAAERKGVTVAFEAAVGGGMPVIKTIRESMIGNDIRSVKTIINGTCNYVLTRMEQDGLPFDEVLRAAQEAGFAEADPTLDIGGGDTGHKVAIMASLLFGGYAPYEKLPIEGLTQITADDIAYARKLGYRIKLLGIIREPHGGAPLDVRVHPAMLRREHILASVSNEFNAVLLNGDAVDDILLYGKGAGEMPTASAVVSDIIDIARDRAAKGATRIPMGFYTKEREIKLQAIDEIVVRYYLRFTVIDQPKVLALITSALGENQISIASVIQPERHQDDRVPVVIVTHPAAERNLQKAIGEIEKMDFITARTQIIRIEE